MSKAILADNYPKFDTFCDTDLPILADNYIEQLYASGKVQLSGISME